MTDNLARQLAVRQMQNARSDLQRDAVRMAEHARQYVDDLNCPGSMSGDVYRLVQEAMDLLRQASRLDGMEQMGFLLPEEKS